jgi:hypothetical protein
MMARRRNNALPAGVAKRLAILATAECLGGPVSVVANLQEQIDAFAKVATAMRGALVDLPPTEQDSIGGSRPSASP